MAILRKYGIDPTLDDYLKVYASSLKLEDALKKQPDYELIKESQLGNKNNWLKELEKANSSYENNTNPNNPYFKQMITNPKISKDIVSQIVDKSKNYKTGDYYERVSPESFYQKELTSGYINPELPSAYYHKGITPTLQHVYSRPESSGKHEDILELYKYHAPTVREEALKKFKGSEEYFNKLDVNYDDQINTSNKESTPNVEVGTLPLRSAQKFATSEQTIIPAKPYIKPTQQNYREWNPATHYGENMEMQEGYTQGDVERKRSEIDRLTFENATKKSIADNLAAAKTKTENIRLAEIQRKNAVLAERANAKNSGLITTSKYPTR
jgi:hypothetical protein